MSAGLQLRHENGRHLEIATSAGVPLWRYVYAPDTPANEARRPYVHPVYSLSGDVLTNFRPNDHPWHHALSLTVTGVDGVNFWGGPTHQAVDGYRWRDDHGEQVHRSWGTLAPERLEEELEWREVKSGRALLDERRVLQTSVQEGAWSLRWTSELRNVAGRDLTLGNYHATGGLAGSHYTGLQFRGARDLLDDHGDATIAITAEGGLAGEGAVHGAMANWMEWSCQHDTTLRRTRIRFESLTGPLPWFVRRKNPVAAFAFHREVSQSLVAGATLRLDHLLTFTRG
jgi:hypothetical protein